MGLIFDNDHILVTYHKRLTHVCDNMVRWTTRLSRCDNVQSWKRLFRKTHWVQGYTIVFATSFVWLDRHCLRLSSFLDKKYMPHCFATCRAIHATAGSWKTSMHLNVASGQTLFDSRNTVLRYAPLLSIDDMTIDLLPTNETDVTLWLTTWRVDSRLVAWESFL